MSDERFVVEANRRIIGIAVRVPDGFRFFASDPDHRALDSRTFSRVRAMAARVAEIARWHESGQADGPGSKLMLH